MVAAQSPQSLLPFGPPARPGRCFMRTQGEKSKQETRFLFMGGRILLHRAAGEWRALVYLPGATECEAPVAGFNRDDVLANAKELMKARVS